MGSDPQVFAARSKEVQLGGWGAGERVLRMETRAEISEPAGQGGAGGGAEKRKRPGVNPGEEPTVPKSRVQGILEEGYNGASRGAGAQRASPGTQTRVGEGEAAACLAQDLHIARRPLTCQQECASGRGAHPACPPTLSSPRTRVSQLPPPGQ